MLCSSEHAFILSRMGCLDQTSLASAYVLEGNVHVSSRQRGETATNSKILPIRIDLVENGAQTTNGKTTKMVVGSLKFGSNGPAPHFIYRLRIAHRSM